MSRRPTLPMNVSPPRLCKYVGGSWNEVEISSEPTDATAETLNVVTYNVWFSPFEMLARTNAILALCEENNADIICLQEVVQESLIAIRASDYVRNSFYISDNTGDTLGDYGVVILSRYPFNRIELIPMKTRMGRSFLISEITVNGKQIAIGTVHLESLSSRAYRSAQMNTIKETLNPYNLALWCGDFNFDSSRNFSPDDTQPIQNDELVALFDDYKDAWSATHSDDAGYTFDTEVNTMLAGKASERMRYDRVMVRDSEQWRIASVGLIGRTKIGYASYRDVLPSDHFGVVCTLAFS